MIFTIFILFYLFSTYETDSSSLSSTDIQITSEKLYSDYQIEYKNESDLEFLKEIGHGKFSTVYKAKLPDGTIVAAKKLRPLEDWKLKKEVKIIEELKGCKHIMQLIGVYGDDFMPIIVTEYCQNELNSIPSYEDLKWVMKSLFEAINETHYHQIFHRDIKWQNMPAGSSARICSRKLRCRRAAGRLCGAPACEYSCFPHL